METLDSTARRLNQLSLAVRLFAALLVGAAVIHCVLALYRAPRFEQVYADLSIKSGLPVATEFLILHWTSVAVGVSVVGMLNIALLLALPRHVWSIPLAAVVVIGACAIAELALYVLQQPLAEIFRSMGA